MDGKPLFVVSQAIDPGLLQVLERDIVPRLEADIPNQPGAEQLDADPLLHRFTVVFDREGYSPEFFAKMKAAVVRLEVETAVDFVGFSLACHARGRGFELRRSRHKIKYLRPIKAPPPKTAGRPKGP